MKTNMNPNSIVPLYEQVAEFLKRDIENGVYNATGKNSDGGRAGRAV